MFSEFKSLQTGDVQIVLGPREDLQFRVHSSVLIEASPDFFAHLVHKDHEAGLEPLPRRQGRPSYHLELTHPPSLEHKAGVLARLKVTSKGILDASQQSIAYAKDQGRPCLHDEQVYRNYKNCFNAMYNRDLDITRNKGITRIMTEVFPLLGIADYLGVVPIVARAVESIFLGHGQAFFKIVSKHPTIWLNQAYLMKSEAIYREALIHTVGRWNDPKLESQKSQIKKDLLPIVNKKIADMINRCKIVEMKIMGLYPRNIQRRDGDNSQRQAYSSDVMFWIALSFFRHWLGQQVISDKTYRADDGGFCFYRQLEQSGPSSYLDRTVLNIFHNRFNMSKKASQVVENHVLEIKELVRHNVVESRLLSNESSLDISKHAVPYLTSCTFNPLTDLPWEVKKANVAVDDDDDDAIDTMTDDMGEHTLHDPQPQIPSRSGAPPIGNPPFKGPRKRTALPESDVEDEVDEDDMIVDISEKEESLSEKATSKESVQVPDGKPASQPGSTQNTPKRRRLHGE